MATVRTSCSSRYPGFMDGTTFSYPGWLQDKGECERLYVEFASPHYCHEKMKAMHNKNRIHLGDRSDPDLVELDSTTFTYKGWEADKAQCVKLYVGDCQTLELGRSSFRAYFERMKKKQALYSARDSIECINKLDKMVFTYDSWRNDVKQAEEFYITYASQSVFNKKVTAMKNRQRIHEGDRSHPDLVALDNTTFNYDGWEADRDKALRLHIGDCYVLDLGEYPFKNLLSTMVKKQTESDRESNNDDEVLGELNSLQLSYPDFEFDKETAKKYYIKFNSHKPFRDKLEAMEKKNRLYQGDRSHPEIVAIDSIAFTYTGWQMDKEEAIRRHTGDCNSILDMGSVAFGTFFKKMKKKEALHKQQQRADNNLELNDLFVQIGNVEASIHTLPPLRKCSSDSTESAAVSSEKAGNNNQHCVVCLESDKSHAFIPCGHQCVCDKCVKEHFSGAGGKANCPLCRQPSLCITKIFC